ncbi:hypothetical protein [Flavobacterium sp.]|uniref:hypothetical protein n=1 Tax=Flavobacterium sp. TaxID=239 RepID=UPI0026210DF8|nr:hypothetical protein [Flavobacterium sp.]
MKNIFLTIFLVFNISESLLSQEIDIEANIKMDLFGNLSINAELLNLEKNQDEIVIDNEILIHNDFAKLIRGVKLNGVQLIEYKPVSKRINFVINLPKSKNSSYLKSSDFFITTINYLPILKSDFSKKKKFDLHFDFPKKFQVIYPDESDLQETYTYPPPIIAGDFIKNTILGFDVFTLENDFNKGKRVKEILTEIDNAFSFFQKFYPNITKKPKIIFIPIKTPDAKTLENAIVFDTKILDEKIPLQKRLIAHEVSHLWWGVGGITLDNRILTEGIAEYLALKYMDNIGEDKYVNNQKNVKLYHIEGNYDFKSALENKKNKKESFVYSYELAPLFLFDMESRGINVFNKLHEFYKNHYLNNSKIIPYQELLYFLNSENKYDLSFNLPDFYITENEGKLYVNCSINRINMVEVEFTNKLDYTYRDTLTFDNNIVKYEFNSQEFKKIIIDPDYQVLQTSRLNDVWNSENTSIFDKNNYYFKNTSLPIVLEKSEKFVDYLLSNSADKIEDFTCESNFGLTKKIKELKDEVDKDKNKSITGASTYLKVNNEYNRIEIKLTYLSEGKSKFVYFYLYFDKNYEYLQNFKLVANESEDIEDDYDN